MNRCYLDGDAGHRFEQGYESSKYGSYFFLPDIHFSLFRRQHLNFDLGNFPFSTHIRMVGWSSLLSGVDM